jgi:hypothetical protein
MEILRDVLPVAVVIGMVVTALTMFVGVFSMSRGGEFNRKWSNKLMRFRVLFQGITVALLLLLVLLSVK